MRSMGNDTTPSSNTARTSSGRSNVGRKPRTTIVDLPPDVLLIIFRIVFRAIALPTFRYGPYVALAPWPAFDNSNYEHPSPECLASVSPLWREAMSNSSQFWTHFVIWIGRDPTPLSRIRQYLTWSRDRPLEIFILRRFDPSLEDLTEKAQVKAVIEVLLPHIKRWTILCMKLLYSSSLPVPRIDLVGRAEKLNALVLDFMVDDLAGSTGIVSPPVGDFDTLMLKTLSMGGVHFREAYVNHFPQATMPPKLETLAITDYDARNAIFPLVDLLQCLVHCPDLCNLELDNLHLDCSYAGPAIPPPNGVMLTWQANVDFVDMDGDVIAEYGRLLRYPLVDAISYTRCSTPTPPNTAFSEACYITLQEINTATALFSLFAPFPGGFRYDEATFTDCAGLTTDVLRRLAETVPDPEAVAVGEDDYIWLCPRLRTLMIYGCAQFRSGDLRAMLEARRRAHEATDFAQYGEPEFEVSSVTLVDVRNCCELAPEDKEWLDTNVSSVRWDGWQGGHHVLH